MLETNYIRLLDREVENTSSGHMVWTIVRKRLPDGGGEHIFPFNKDQEVVQ